MASSPANLRSALGAFLKAVLIPPVLTPECSGDAHDGGFYLGVIGQPLF